MLCATSASHLCKGLWHEPYSGQLPEEGQHGPGTGRQSWVQLSCPKKPSHLSLSSPQGRIPPGNCLQGAVFKAPGAQRSPSCPGPRVAARPAAVPATLPKQRFKCHLVARGPRGTHGHPPGSLSPLGSLPPRCNPLFSTEPPTAITLLFAPLCSRLSPRVSFFPLSHILLFPCPYILPLCPSRWGHLCLGPSHSTMQQPPRRGESKASDGLVSPQAHKAWRWLCKGTTCPVQTPECLCCHLCALSPSDIPKVGPAASKALGLQREPTAGCCGPQHQLPKDSFGATLSVVRATRGL